MNIVERLIHTFNQDEDYLFTKQDIDELNDLQNTVEGFERALKRIRSHGGKHYDGDDCSDFAEEQLSLFS